LSRKQPSAWLGIGLSLGWLAGLSASPVIGAVLAALVVGAVGLLAARAN